MSSPRHRSSSRWLLIATLGIGGACRPASPPAQPAAAVAGARAADATAAHDAPAASAATATSSGSPAVTGDPPLVLTLQPPAAGGERATVRIAPGAPNGLGSPLTVVVRLGDQVVRVEPGQHRDLAVAAGDGAQRWLLGDTPLWLQVRPGATYRVADHPCYGWELHEARLDPSQVGSDLAYCERDGVDCRAGYDDAHPQITDDPRCVRRFPADVETKRCARQPQIRLAGPAPDPVSLHLPGSGVEDAIRLGAAPLAAGATGAWQSTSFASCGPIWVSAGGRDAAIYGEVGARWTLRVVDGEIVGSVEPRGP